MNFLDIFSQTTNSLVFLVFLTSFRCLARAEKTGSPFDWPEKDFHENLLNMRCRWSWRVGERYLHVHGYSHWLRQLPGRFHGTEFIVLTVIIFSS